MQPDPRWTAGDPCGLPSEGLHEAVARHALARPGAVAVAAGDRTVSYAELDRDADAWAAALAAAGVRHGDRVPILMPRSVELITALLAVLKTGAAYALLEPSWPARRLREVTEELGAPLLVAARGGLGDQSAAPGDPSTPVWSPPEGPVPVPPGFRPVGVEGSEPCCVFFTSGTTGRPKGVLSPHRATARLFQPGGFARFSARTVVPLAAPVPWDAFSLELWSALLSGGTSLVVAEPYLSALALRNGVCQRRVETVWLTSSLFNMIVDEDLDAFAGVSQVMTGGERLSVAHVGRFLSRHPAIALINGYGPVESTVFATTHRIRPADCERPGGIPIGRPVTGTQVHVLDGSRPCAVGERGEICIAGDGLALRYLNDAALTDAKFVTERIGGTPVRVYRTGDLGEWDSDGLLHYRGRADRQLKIRGHRIEPAEIERQVERLLPSVRSCRVLARGDAAGGGQELVAFWVPAEPGDRLEPAMPLLRSALVSYQRPAAVVSVDAFPVTPQGKLDERALLALAPQAHADAQAEADAPDQDQDTMSRLVAETFAAVLGRPAVPPDQPFTELGGTSLGAGRVCARLSARLARPVPLSWLYQHPTAGSLARRLRAAAPAESRATAESQETPDQVPLTPMQMVYLTRHLVDPADRTGHCLLTWAIEGDLDHAALEAAIAAAHERHESLRAAYAPDPRPAAWLVDAPAPLLEILPGQPSADAAVRALRAELALGLEPTEAEVWRTAIVPVHGGSVTLFGCVVHHIAFDGWSESVLAADIATGYDPARGTHANGTHGHANGTHGHANGTYGHANGTHAAAPQPPSLAAIHRQYAEHTASSDPNRHHDYLLTELQDVPALRWPPAGEPHANEPREIEVRLGPDVVAAADALAARTGVTRFVVLLAHYAASLAEVTGQHDFAVGVPVAQRFAPGLERAVGCHINMVCLRLRGAALTGGAAAVRETGRIAGRAFAAQDVPFSDVLGLLRPPRSDRPPLFQTLFALQDNPVPRLSLAGLRTTFLRQPYLQLPLEFHAELWPGEDGGIRLAVSFRPDAVPEDTAREFTKRFTDRLHATSSGAGHDRSYP